MNARKEKESSRNPAFETSFGTHVETRLAASPQWAGKHAKLFFTLVLTLVFLQYCADFSFPLKFTQFA